MDRSSYILMSPSNEAPNPLRPYYRPPSIGFADSSPRDTPGAGPRSTPLASGGGIFDDFNLDGMLGERQSRPSTVETFRTLTNAMMWKYTSVFMAQPFEVAKTVLQVRCAPSAERAPSAGGRRQNNAWKSQSRRSSQQSFADERIVMESSEEGEEEGDETSYFTSKAPELRSMVDSRPRTPDYQTDSSRHGRGEGARNSSSRSSMGREPADMLDLKRPDSLMEVLGQLWLKEGAWGVWKGTNVSFLHSFLLKAIETWTRSMLSATLSLPDPGVGMLPGGLGGLDILDSPSPMYSLGISIVAAGIAGLALAPLDAVRTRILLTPTSQAPRSTMACLNALPSWIAAPSLISPTLLHSTLPVAISTSTPLFLRSYLHIDPIISPSSFNVFTFFSSVVELFVKLPFETVLRRAQIDFVSQRDPQRRPKSRSGRNARQKGSANTDENYVGLKTVVPTGPYVGVMGTMWRIAREEGTTIQRKQSSTDSRHGTAVAAKKGQGIEGLWRGWRVGFWALMGVWGTSALGSGRAMGNEF